jgi:hypothetical protein
MKFTTRAPRLGDAAMMCNREQLLAQLSGYCRGWSSRMNLIVLLIILLLLFGGGGFYVGGPLIGGSLGGIILIILIVLLLSGKRL